MHFFTKNRTSPDPGGHVCTAWLCLTVQMIIANWPSLY